METKKWFESKTLWVNAISIVGVFLAKHFGIEITAEMTVTILGVINAILRFITKQPIVIS
jgi:uncharacterized membrane protein